MVLEMVLLSLIATSLRLLSSPIFIGSRYQRPLFHKRKQSSFFTSNTSFDIAWGGNFRIRFKPHITIGSHNSWWINYSIILLFVSKAVQFGRCLWRRSFYVTINKSKKGQSGRI
jgi:hypothetical protein